MRAVLFDFGGTLDADGIAWKDRFYACYRDQGLAISPEAFARAFYDADDPLVGAIPEATGLDGTVAQLVANLEARLGQDNTRRGDRVSTRFLADSRATLARNAGVLARLARRYALGIVSNFYGNLAAVCADTGIGRHLSIVVDSAKIGAEKPAPAIFEAALEGLGARAEDCVFVGDSLHRDRTGARNMGMRFVWVAPPETRAQAAEERRIASVAELEEVLA